MKQRSLFIWTLLFLILMSVLVFRYISATPVSSGREEVEPLDYYQPLQEKINMKPFIMEAKGVEFTIYPVARYTVHGMLLSKKNYYWGTMASLCPVDLALAWGGMMEEEANQHLRYWQGNRWYYYNYSKDFPYNLSYISSQTSNNHIIPANENILNTLNRFSKGDRFTLYGYLVNVTLEGSDGNVIEWKTSLSRTDTGGGACEIIYVKKINVDGLVYE